MTVPTRSTIPSCPTGSQVLIAPINLSVGDQLQSILNTRPRGGCAPRRHSRFPTKKLNEVAISRQQQQEEPMTFSGLQRYLHNQPDCHLQLGSRGRMKRSRDRDTEKCQAEYRLSRPGDSHIFRVTCHNDSENRWHVLSFCFSFHLEPCINTGSRDSCLFLNVRPQPGYFAAYVFCVGHFIK